MSESEETSEAGLHFLLHRPAGHVGIGRAWPLLLYLHGRGEVGIGRTSLQRVKTKGSPPHLATLGKLEGFVVVSPQNPMDPTIVAKTDRAWEPAASRLAGLMRELLRRKELGIDRQRIYAIGYSMGGKGLVHLVSILPLFAAWVAVDSQPGWKRSDAHAAAETPAWVAYGSNKKCRESGMELATVLRECSKREVVEVDVGLADHVKVATLVFSGSSTHKGQDIYQWLWDHKRAS